MKQSEILSRVTQKAASLHVETKSVKVYVDCIHDVVHAWP